MSTFSTYPFRIKSFSRLRKVISVISKYGFDEIVSHTPLNKIISRRRISSLKKEGKKIVAHTRYERIRLIFEELGPTFIKLGQLLSNRPDILPQEMIREFEKLQDNVSYQQDIDVNNIIRREFNVDIDNEFEKVIEDPEASASIAVVFKAKIKNEGWVVLKILRPGIKNIIDTDIEILRYIIKILSNRFPEFAAIRPLDLLASFERSIQIELNFRVEAASIKRFHNNFKDDDRIYVPKVYDKFSNNKVICMEKVVGTKISNLEELKKKEIDLDRVINAGVDLYFKQVFKYGYFHADPHPGNIIILNDERICFLDFGMMGLILPKDKEIMGEMIVNFMQQDVKRLIKNIEQLAAESHIEDHKSLSYDLYDLIQEINSASLKDINLQMIYDRFQKILYIHQIVVPADLFLLMRAFVVLEGLGLMLKPDFNLIETMKPYAKTILWDHYNPKALVSKAFDAFYDIKDMMDTMPGDLKSIAEKVKEGKLRIAFAHQGLEGFYSSLDRISNRLSLAVITAALIIGSSLVVLSGVPPLVFNIPVIGVIGFFISVVLGIIIIISIIRKSKI